MTTSTPVSCHTGCLDTRVPRRQQAGLSDTLTTLAAFIRWHRGRQEHPAVHIATQGPDGQKPESRVKRFARWLDNERILRRCALPYAEILLTH